ncbi:ABC transporter ATP-binding protein [Nostoc sp. T09]|uniref:ABC transporter ATP-binding protein n=1 Tax=Nostoc sp. T09 TaxID=1932621 RepID=UPI000A361F9D|nr:ABC transporter ATP-binding protein [Nostoc sp. T09]OUL36822.1 ABC transporter ATP-binding protein [Nostoc sp. T09]
MTISINEQEMALKPQDSDSEIVLSVNGVSKKFCRDLKRSLMYGVQDITSELLGLREKSDKLRTKEFWALDNVSFELRRGEALGLVGKNGSGKSTLLRIIAGLIKPDTGFVEVNGRVAPLIALGAGFNPILTGRENIYANMSILGLSTKEIDERFDEVVDFAEIGDAIDAPVQSYSSGMAARLGFACAIHVNPEILLIDEVLAVGDIKFRVKCYRYLAKLREQGTTFILVSHDPNAILGVCKSSIYLSQGNVIAVGDTSSIMNRYEEDLFMKNRGNLANQLVLPKKSVEEGTDLNITYLCFKDNEGKIAKSLVSGQRVTFCIGCQVHKSIDNVTLNLLVREESGGDETILRLSSFNDNKYFNIQPGEHELQVQMQYLCLKPGLYSMKLGISKSSLYILDAIESFEFSIEKSENMSQCLFYQPRLWTLIENI